MGLEPLKLDDLNWSEMVVAIRRRIAPVSDGKWTLHAPVDPGVTLLELFAYLLEQRVYWLDQVPDALVHATLALMGEERRPAQAASTVLRFQSSDFKVLPPLSEVRLRQAVPPLIFSTDAEISLLPFDESEQERSRIHLYIGEQDRTSDLEQERTLCLFPADGSAAEVRLVLWLREELAAGAGKLTLFFDLEVTGDVPPQWSNEAVEDVPPPVEMKWLYKRPGASAPQPFPAERVEDGTGGLRRSGIVMLTLPDDWEHDAPDPKLPDLFGYSLWLRVERATFSSPPKVRRIIPNTVIARHVRQTIEHHLDVTKFNWKQSLPGNEVPLTEIPEDALEADYPPLEDTVKLRIIERGGEYEWKRTQSFAFAGPQDRVFIVDRETGALRFGDGLTGRLPVPDTNRQTNLKLQYRVGGGASGNLGNNRRWELSADPKLTAKNVVPADGGVETESLEAAKQRATAGLRKIERAITGDDHETIVLTIPGVAFKRARYALGHHPAHPCRIVPGAVTVYVVPDVPRPEEEEGAADECAYVAAPVPDPGALASASARLDKARLITSEVFVRAPRYRPVSLAVEVTGDPADLSTLRQRVTRRLKTFLDPLRGGERKEGWPFGEPLRPSVLLREAQRAVGEDGNVTSVAIGLDGKRPQESCSDVAIAEHELVTLQDVAVRLQRAASNQGGLR